MNRKDYEAVAHAVSVIYGRPDVDKKTMHLMIGAMTARFALDNANFNEDRFVEACMKGRS